jgi:hypothetical protein
MALALGVTFIGAIFHPWWYVAGFAFAMTAFAGWAWPRGSEHADETVKPRGYRRMEKRS